MVLGDTASQQCVSVYGNSLSSWSDIELILSEHPDKADGFTED